MCEIYTLRKPMTGVRGKLLNGKLLRIFMNDDKEVLFKDAITGEHLWKTSRVVIPPHPSSTTQDEGISFSTDLGSEYDLVNVASLLPTKATETKKVNSEHLDVTDVEPKKVTTCGLSEEDTGKLPINVFDVFDKKLLDELDAKNIKTIRDAVEYLKQKKTFSAILNKVVRFNKKSETEKILVNCLRSVGYKIVAEYPDDHDWESDDDDCTWEVKGFEGLDFKSSSDFKVIYSFTFHKGINYGDGYDKTMFAFSRDLTESEFIQFLNENDYKIHVQDGWWDNYSKIDGKGQKWNYTWVLVYTD